MKQRILAILLSLTMMFTLVPTAMAEGEEVSAGEGSETPAVEYAAQIGDEKYDTLAAAINAAGTGGTVKLLADITGQTVIPAEKDIVLDLNGKTMTHTETTLYNSGKLTVRDSSADKSGKIVSTGNVGIGVNHDSTTTIEYANIEAVEGAVITGYATGAKITIEDGIFEASDNAVIAGNGNSTDHNGEEREKANTITINGGKFTGNIKTTGYIACGIYAPWKDIVTVNGGEFTVNNGIGIVARAGQVKVNGGTFTCTGSAEGKVGDKNFDMAAAQCLYFDATDPAYPAYNSETDYIKVTGGTFSSNVSAYVADGYTYNSETKTVEPLGETNSVAKVGDTYYKTLAEAVAAADNATVTLLKDVTANVTIPAGNTITLNLNGHTLVDSATAQDKNVAEDSRKHTITNNGTLTILDSVGTGVVDNVSHGRAALYNAGTIVEIKGGKFTRSVDNSTDATSAKGNSWYVVYNAENATINRISDGEFLAIGEFSSLFCNCGLINEISGGTFTQNGFIAFKNEGTVNKISGGTFSSEDESCIQNWGSIGEITGGTITDGSIGIWNFSSDKYNSVGKVGQISGGNISGSTAAIRLNDYDTTYLNKPSTINKASVAVSGGNISGNLQVNANTELSVSGGSFSQSVERKYLDQSLNAELKRTGGETPYSYYPDVAAAAAAAQPGDTVTDLKATTESKVTLTLKYNDGATADTTYNVASGTTITLPAPTRIGYTFNGWYDGSKFYAAGASYKVSATATLNASWSYISSGSSSYDPTYSVSTPSKTENGSVTVSPKSASKGDTVTVTVKPDSGYVLETLTVTDKNGDELKLTDKGNGKYTFTMPGSKVEVKATFMEDNSVLNFFYDVPNGAYFYEAVKWAVKNGITTGVGNDLFAPEQPCTRAQIVTFLWRAAGSPEPKTASSFTDVSANAYYAKAVAWAVENGITNGMTETTFAPDATCTRGQSVTFLYRALKGTASATSSFVDVSANAFYADAVGWAVSGKVTDGTSSTTFSPDDNCTRGQIVTFLYRAYQGK